ncbi:MAG: hypothetical protein AVDCRST_MAG02-3675 [uncultured Rubrobacteraceae bacterium]|uniref:Uncharacterized protein n=1 Tax=uncultured Rubrobacteraceae bacterium TaxID=349277 RepID=A0A6J4RCW8_9ACTN|nr:MAG: hypothetical protein AVDCRST_MAG02-3675 [uncultured Rubrobacteraceae bacterium]
MTSGSRETIFFVASIQLPLSVRRPRHQVPERPPVTPL